MKQETIHRTTILLTALVFIMSGIVYASYIKEISNAIIVNEIHGEGNNFRYTYVRVIIPQESYHGYITLISIYWKIRIGHGKQSWTEIVVYDTWEDIRSDREYTYYRFSEET